MTIKSFLTLGPDVDIIKLFMAVIYKFLNELECLLLAGLSCLVQCLWVRAGAFPIVTRECSGLNLNEYTSLEKFARSNYSRLSQTLVPKKLECFFLTSFFSPGDWST